MNLNSFPAHLKNKLKKRPGRGIGSGKGKTSGRGHKGQKSRSGVAIKKKIAIINLSKLQENFKNKKIPSNTKLNLSLLQKSNLINKKYNKLKVLGSGEIKEKLEIEVNYISNSAKQKIEKSGGKVSLIK